jgi:uncharacterized surface protein with fasciclin (FAS1) repeats
MKQFKYIGISIAAAGLLVAASCSDFSDYNDTKVDATPSASATLWQNITENPQLTDFAKLVRKAGFDDDLNTSHFYTVWAPLDGTYDAAALMQNDSADILYQFVKNHVAEYNHVASGAFDKRIRTLNKKSFDFGGNGSYTYGGHAVVQPNLPSINGVMHTLSGAAKYYPSIYQYLDINDTVSLFNNYLKRYEYTYLDESNSVPGPMVGGLQTYIDSVMVTTNNMLSRLRSHIDREDSSYTVILPDNNAWRNAYSRIASCYNYIAKTKVQDLEVKAGSSSTTITEKTINIDAAHMKDSITNLFLAASLTFSNNDTYNKWLTDASQTSKDTLRTTTRNRLSNPADILARVQETDTMSNGVVHIVDSLAMYPWETYNPALYVTPFYNRVARVLTGNSTTVRVGRPDPSKGTFENGSLSYLWVAPTTNYAKPELDLYLPDVLSATYKFYCVFVPQNVDPDDTTTVIKPNQVNFTLSYCNAKGDLAEHRFSSKAGDNNPKTPTPFENNTEKVDTVYLGQFTFPVAYAGLADHYPNIKITTPFSVFNKTMMAKYTRDLRIAAIIMKPVEYAEFEEKQK